MALPETYTEETLAFWLRWSVLRQTAEILGMLVTDPGGDYQDIIDSTLESYGVKTIAEATDLKKLRALARYQCWKYVADQTAGEHNVNADGAHFNRDQIHDHAKEREALARADAGPYFPINPKRGRGGQSIAIPVENVY